MKHVLLMVLVAVGLGTLGYADDASALTGTVKSVDGNDVKLESYKGKVVLVVNVASRCGFTKQYKQLQAVYSKYKDRGFTVLAFPCNQFGKQEPGSDAEIKAFCEKRFAVEFPIFSKVEVNGDNAAPLYKYLTSDKAPLTDKGKVKWNFEKFLFGRDGKLIERYRSRVKPDDTTVAAAIEAALGPVAADKADAEPTK